jgi:hypothetical protein
MSTPGQSGAKGDPFANDLYRRDAPDSGARLRARSLREGGRWTPALSIRGGARGAVNSLLVTSRPQMHSRSRSDYCSCWNR